MHGINLKKEFEFFYIPAEMNFSGIPPSTFLCVAVNTISSKADNTTKGERVCRKEHIETLFETELHVSEWKCLYLLVLYHGSNHNY